MTNYDIVLHNENATLSIEKKSININYLLKNTDGQSIWLSEKELMELRYMIDDITQMINKRDY